MKKLFSIVLMVLVAACMTGCSLHGGHGHGPNTGNMMTLRTSVPASVFAPAPANLRGALRADTANREKFTVEFGGQVLAFEYEDTINNILYFAKQVAKAVVQEMAAKGDDDKVEIIVKNAAGNAVAQIKVDLPDNFADDTAATENKQTSAGVKISADENGDITGAGTVSVSQMVESIGKAVEEIVKALAAQESTKQEIVVVDGETEKTIKKEEQPSDVTVVISGETKEVTFKFYRVSGFETISEDSSSNIRFASVKDGYQLGEEITDGATVYRWLTGTAIAVVPSVKMFEGNDESKYLNTASATLELTATNSKGSKVTITSMDQDEILSRYGVDIHTHNGMWFITLDGSNVPAGSLSFEFKKGAIPTVDGKTVYTWKSPTSIRVTVSDPVANDLR